MTSALGRLNLTLLALRLCAPTGFGRGYVSTAPRSAFFFLKGSHLGLQRVAQASSRHCQGAGCQALLPEQCEALPLLPSSPSAVMAGKALTLKKAGIRILNQLCRVSLEPWDHTQARDKTLGRNLFEELQSMCRELRDTGHLWEPQTCKCLVKSGIGAECLHRRGYSFKGQARSNMS